MIMDDVKNPIIITELIERRSILWSLSRERSKAKFGGGVRHRLVQEYTRYECHQRSNCSKLDCGDTILCHDILL
jgi:hypothetical protein